MYRDDHSRCIAGAQVETQPGGPSVVRIRGSVYHCLGPLLPLEDGHPGFAQLYICDNELENRTAVFPDLEPDLLAQLQHTLHDSNSFIQTFKRFARTEEAADMDLTILQTGNSCSLCCRDGLM